MGAFAVASAFALIGFLVPGGLGVREVAMTLALSPVMPTVPAIAVAVLSRILQIAIEVAGALWGQCGPPIQVRLLSSAVSRAKIRNPRRGGAPWQE